MNPLEIRSTMCCKLLFLFTYVYVFVHIYTDIGRERERKTKKMLNLQYSAMVVYHACLHDVVLWGQVSLVSSNVCWIKEQPKWIKVVSSPACLLVVADPWQAVGILSVPRLSSGQTLAMLGGSKG